MKPRARTRDAAIEAMETAFGTTIKRPTGDRRGKWIVWTSVHRSSAISKHVATASDLGAEGVFIEPVPRSGSRVGCLNPDRSDP